MPFQFEMWVDARMCPGMGTMFGERPFPYGYAIRLW